MRWSSVAIGCLLMSGCAAFPDIAHRPTVHNPFPQLRRVAVMPFHNLSEEPTVDGEKIAVSYYGELQKIPGFEVIPVGVVIQKMRAIDFPASGAGTDDYRRLAQSLGADAVVAGAVTDYEIYPPPRLALVVNWYAANPGFHPIPPGYGLPWGTASEEDIPSSLLFEAEFALAAEQLDTQTPRPEQRDPLAPGSVEEIPSPGTRSRSAVPLRADMAEQGLPPDWPDPKGFIPPAPRAIRPAYRPQKRPVMSLARFYDGNDSDFTERLAKYYYFRDDSRFGGWQSYLTHSDDFIRFCCHLHIHEMLVARGGAGKSRVVWRWPIGRYER